MEKYYNTHQFSQLASVTPQTLRNWDKNGKLEPHHKSPSGTRYYSQQQLDNYLNRYGAKPPARLHISYARVSTNKQKTSLTNQIEQLKLYQAAKGRSATVITDIGSGLNYTKPGLEKLLTLILENKVETITVTHKDRLLRFGVPLLETICAHFGAQIEYLEAALENSEEQVAQDVLEVLTVYSAKLHGKRATKAKLLAKELEQCS